MTLRTRLLAAMGVVAVLLSVASMAVIRTTTADLVGQVDDQLLRFSEPGRGPGAGPGGGSPLPPSPPPEESGNMFSSVFIGVFDGDEIETRVAPNLGGVTGAVPDLDRAEAAELAESGEPRSVGSTVEGTDYRVRVRSEEGSLVVAAIPLDDVNAAISRLIGVQLATTVAVLVILGLVTWWVLRLGVRPIRSMTDAATTVANGDLSHRIPEAHPGTEAGDLGAALNTMLNKIEEAFDERSRSEERMRRFVADASHELRTPLTTIRGYAELYRVGALDDDSQLSSAMARTESESIRMTRLVEDLLALARLDEGRSRPIERTSFDEVVAAAVADVLVAHPDRGVELHCDRVEVLGDADQLQQLVLNLVANAMAHTSPDSRVTVSLSAEGTHAVLVVADDGPGMDEEDRARAFERFYRSDPSRSRESGGSGLGLSIVAAIVDLHGGRVRLEPTSPDGGERQGLTVTVEIPLAGPES